jgi:hypothetical protein
MRTYRLFQNGDGVQFVVAGHPLAGARGEIVGVERDGRYRVRVGRGLILCVFAHEIAPLLPPHIEEALKRAHLVQLAHLAVEIGDRDWFYEMTHRLSLLAK